MTDLVQKGRALILRTCNADMSSRNGFVWPESGLVECPDWNPTKVCGNGLHGALWGEGSGVLLSFEADAKWLVAEIEEWIDLDGKVKFPRANVLHCGDQKSATDFIIANGATGAVIGASVSAGNYGTAIAGDRGTATAGYMGTAAAGDMGILQIKWYDGSRYRIATAYVGENGIKPNTPYKLTREGKFVEVEQ